jgi:hypothetical protein
MGELHLCWMGNIEQLKQFVSDNIELNGVWVSPGGDKINIAMATLQYRGVKAIKFCE